MPKTRQEFWKAKFEYNVERDRKVRQQLLDMGWRVNTLWECELTDIDHVAKKLEKHLNSDSNREEKSG
jgi:DNA mismatch endonuclease (patch repair protein)